MWTTRTISPHAWLHEYLIVWHACSAWLLAKVDSYDFWRNLIFTETRATDGQTDHGSHTHKLDWHHRPDNFLFLLVGGVSIDSCFDAVGWGDDIAGRRPWRRRRPGRRLLHQILLPGLVLVREAEEGRVFLFRVVFLKENIFFLLFSLFINLILFINLFISLFFSPARRGRGNILTADPETLFLSKQTGLLSLWDAVCN